MATDTKVNGIGHGTGILAVVVRLVALTGRPAIKVRNAAEVSGLQIVPSHRYSAATINISIIPDMIFSLVAIVSWLRFTNTSIFTTIISLKNAKYMR